MKVHFGMPLPLAGEAAGRLVRVVERSEIVTSLDQEPLIRPPGTFSRSREKEEMVMTHFEMLLPLAGEAADRLMRVAERSESELAPLRAAFEAAGVRIEGGTA
ncbi:MAG: hypothetical protein R3F08_00115 [Dokdonella sp.]